MLFDEDKLTDEEIEELFSTSKRSKRARGSRRKTDYKKACRKQAIAQHQDIAWYDNLHQYSKNKVHCSCRLCRGKDYAGRHIETRQERKNKASWADFEDDYIAS